jgi:hypothetical protein
MSQGKNTPEKAPHNPVQITIKIEVGSLQENKALKTNPPNAHKQQKIGMQIRLHKMKHNNFKYLFISFN